MPKLPPKKSLPKRKTNVPTSQPLEAAQKPLKSPQNSPKKTTHKSTWKAFERTVAADFGTRRTPLSGSNGGVTSADTLHEKLFIEAKLRNAFSLWKLYEDTKAKAKKENKVPIVAIKEKSKTGYLLLVSPKDMEEILKYYKKNEGE